MSKIHSAWLFMCKHKYLLTVLLIVLFVGVVDEDSFLNRHLGKKLQITSNNTTKPTGRFVTWRTIRRL